MIHPVHPSAVLKEWPRALPWLEKAFEHSEDDSAGQHLPMLLTDMEQLWHINESAWALTRVVQGKQERVLQFIALGGKEIDAWLTEFLAEAESWGKSHGCKKAIVAGRPGWRRKLPEYRNTHITLSKELRDA